MIVQVKDNQPTLFKHAQRTCATKPPLDSVATRDRARSRDEIRTVSVFDAKDTLADTEWHNLVLAIVRVDRETTTRDAKTGLWNSTTEVALYVSNDHAPAIDFTDAIRGHWGIENRSHYTRDVTMGEDGSRIRCKPSLFARLRSFAYNILPKNQADTIRQDRYHAALAGIDYLLALRVT